MNKIFMVLAVVVLLYPLSLLAHGMETQDTGTGFGMMRYIEDQALGDETHEEMEELMEKMMEGELSQTEASRLVTLMGEYPGPYSTMMGRMMGMRIGASPWGMMTTGGSFLVWIVMLLYLVWLLVGILAIVWLWQNITKK